MFQIIYNKKLQRNINLKTIHIKYLNINLNRINNNQLNHQWKVVIKI